MSNLHDQEKEDRSEAGPQPKRQRIDDGTRHTVDPVADSDDAAFWLAAAQETSQIVAPPLATVSLTQSRVPMPPRATPHAHRSSVATATASSLPTAMANSSSLSQSRSLPPSVRPPPQSRLGTTAPTRRPGDSAPVQSVPQRSALAPPYLFGISTVQRLRPPMANPDDPLFDDKSDGSLRPPQHHASLPLQTSDKTQPTQTRPGPPMLFSASKPALPAPIILPYTPSAAPTGSQAPTSYRRSGGASPLPGHENVIKGVMCNCAQGTREAKTAVAATGANTGRRYYVCHQRNQTGGCKFWLWQDDHGKSQAAPDRDPCAPHYREHLAHDLLYASGGRTAERLVVLARQAAPRDPLSSGAPTEDDAPKAAVSKETADAWIEAVTDRWNVTRPVSTDPTETDAVGAARGMPLVDLDKPMGDTARKACHPHVTRQITCTALLAHMFAARGWRVVVQPPLMAFYHHVHLYIARGRYDKVAYWVRVEPAQRMDPRDPPSTPVQHDSLWVQAAGPDPDTPGWLTGSHVDLVAFEADEGFLLVDRRHLWRYVDRHVMKAGSPGADTATASITVTDPAQADHRLLDMGAVGQSPHERRTLLSIEALFQHDDVERAKHAASPAKCKAVVQETLAFDAAIAVPYLARMGRDMPLDLAKMAASLSEATPAESSPATADSGNSADSALDGNNLSTA